MIASYGEILFVPTGVVYQVFGIAFEAVRLVMVERLLSSAEYKMDPLVSLYYFAPVCAFMNFLMFLIFESSTLAMSDLARVGLIMFFFNALVAFCLNVSVVFLVKFAPSFSFFYVLIRIRSGKPRLLCSHSAVS